MPLGKLTHCAQAARGRLRRPNREKSVNCSRQPTWQEIWPAGSSEQSTTVHGVYRPLPVFHLATVIWALA